MLKITKSVFSVMNKKGLMWDTLIITLFVVLTIILAIIFLSKGDPLGMIGNIFH
jgi:hypothetical protein